MAINNNYSCIMKNILQSRDAANTVMQRIIVDGNSTSMWYDPWINHKSMVDLLGWHRINICSDATLMVNSILEEGSLHPQLSSSTREFKMKSITCRWLLIIILTTEKL